MPNKAPDLRTMSFYVHMFYISRRVDILNNYYNINVDVAFGL